MNNQLKSDSQFTLAYFYKDLSGITIILTNIAIEKVKEKFKSENSDTKVVMSVR